jgi:hypothetical protein
MMRMIVTVACVVLVIVGVFIAALKFFSLRQEYVAHQERVETLYQEFRQSVLREEWGDALAMMSPKCRQAVLADLFELLTSKQEQSSETPPVGLPRLTNRKQFQDEITSRPELLNAAIDYAGQPVLQARDLTELHVDWSFETACGVETSGSETAERTLQFVCNGEHWLIDGISR